jgi:hypothetical protein
MASCNFLILEFGTLPKPSLLPLTKYQTAVENHKEFPTASPFMNNTLQHLMFMGFLIHQQGAVCSGMLHIPVYSAVILSYSTSHCEVTVYVSSSSLAEQCTAIWMVMVQPLDNSDGQKTKLTA